MPQAEKVVRYIAPKVSVSEEIKNKYRPLFISRINCAVFIIEINVNQIKSSVQFEIQNFQIESEEHESCRFCNLPHKQWKKTDEKGKELSKRKVLHGR